MDEEAHEGLAEESDHGPSRPFRPRIHGRILSLNLLQFARARFRGHDGEFVFPRSSHRHEEGIHGDDALEFGTSCIAGQKTLLLFLRGFGDSAAKYVCEVHPLIRPRD